MSDAVKLAIHRLTSSTAPTGVVTGTVGPFEVSLSTDGTDPVVTGIAAETAIKAGRFDMTLLDETTLAAADTTAPVLSAASGGTPGQTSTTATVDTDEGAGTLYWLVTDQATNPDAATIKAGSSQAVSATGTQNVSLTGLTAGTAYRVSFIQDDDATPPNPSNIVSADFTMAAAAGAPVIASTTPADDATDVAADTQIVATFGENVVWTGAAGDIVIRNVTQQSDIEVIPNLANRGGGPGQVSILLNTDLNIIPSNPLPAGDEIAIQIAAGIIEAADDGTDFGGIADETTWSFTVAAGDTVAPGIGTLTMGTVGTTTADASVNVTIESGETGVNLYYLVTADTDPAPGRGDVLSTGTAQSVTASGAQTINLTALNAGQGYRLSAAAEDAAGNASGLREVTFTTGA